MFLCDRRVLIKLNAGLSRYTWNRIFADNENKDYIFQNYLEITVKMEQQKV